MDLIQLFSLDFGLVYIGCAVMTALLNSANSSLQAKATPC